MTRRQLAQPLPVLLLTPEQAAEICQISRGKLDEWTFRAGFPVIREGGIVRIPLERFKAWLAAQADRTNGQSDQIADVVRSVYSASEGRRGA